MGIRLTISKGEMHREKHKHALLTGRSIPGLLVGRALT
jgi:hypothetical protein